MKLIHEFAEINSLIAVAKGKAFAAVNKELVQLYFTVGKYVSNKLKSASWGDAVVAQLAHYLKDQDPSLKGFDKRGISRMVQFYNAYSNQAFIETIPANLLNQLLDFKSPMVTKIQSYDYEADKIVTPLVTQLSWTHHLIPAMIADYQLALPNKKLLHDKWLEILEMNDKEGAIK